MLIVYAESATPRRLVGVTSETYIWPTVRAMPNVNVSIKTGVEYPTIGQIFSPIPSPSALTVFPPRNWPGVEAVYTIATPAKEKMLAAAKAGLRPKRSAMGPAAYAPMPVLNCDIAFQRDCQYAGIMYSVPRWTPNVSL